MDDDTCVGLVQHPKSRMDQEGYLAATAHAIVMINDTLYIICRICILYIVIYIISDFVLYPC